MSFKSFFIDFKKHFTQAFATLAAGIIIGWLFGGAKVIKEQREQSAIIDSLQTSVGTLVIQKKNFDLLNVKLDTLLEQNETIKRELAIQKAIDVDKTERMSKDIEIIRRNTEENNKRMFELFKK